MADVIESVISVLGGSDTSSTSTIQTTSTTKTKAGPSDDPAGTSASSHKTQTEISAKASSVTSTANSTNVTKPSRTALATRSHTSSNMTQKTTIANAKNVQTSQSATDTLISVTSITNTLPTGSILSVINPEPSTTFVTSTSTSISDSTSSSAPSISSPPEALSSATANSTSAAPSPSPASNADHGIPTAGIVVASAMGFMALMGILFILVRYCNPIRRRWDLWREQKRLARSYRSTLDDPAAIPETKSVDSLPRANTFSNQRYYSNEQPIPGTQMTQAQGTGLGIGSRLSLLMQHSPFQTGDRASNVRRSQIGVAVSGSKYDRDLPPLPR